MTTKIQQAMHEIEEEQFLLNNKIQSLKSMIARYVEVQQNGNKTGNNSVKQK